MAEIAEALELGKGRIHHAAKYLRCAPATIYRYLREFPELQEVRVFHYGLRGDLIESKLDAAVERGEPWAICFSLRTQYRDRGYSERPEKRPNDHPQFQVSLAEMKREKLIETVKTGLKQDWTLRTTLEALMMQGVTQESLTLVRSDDLTSNGIEKE